MNYIEMLLPIGLALFGGIIAYAAGFGVGRRSAYRDVDLNLEPSKKTEFTRTPEWRSKTKALLTTHTIVK